MIINSSTFSDFVANMKITWLDQFEQVPRNAAQLYKVKPSDEKITDYSSLDHPTFARRVEEGDDFRQLSPTQGYRKTMTKYRIAAEDVITWEMRRYSRYDEMEQVIRGLATTAAQRMDIDKTHRFTFATATSYTDMDGTSVTTTTGDGLSLLSTAHTVTGSSTTFRNRIAGNPTLSKGGLEAAELLFATQMINMSGDKVRPMPDTIIIADNPTHENIALEYLNSTAAPDFSNSGVANVYKAKYRLVVLPYLATTAAGARDSSKENYWFLADVKNTSAICEVSEEPHLVAPSVGSNAEEFDNDNWKFKTTAAYGIEIVTPHWIVGSTGDGTA
jgi:hypothetical protein